MKFPILIVAALAMLLSGCATDNEPGSTLRTSCRISGFTLGTATRVKPTFSVDTRTSVSRVVAGIDPLCSPLTQPPPDEAKQKIFDAVLAELVSIILASGAPPLAAAEAPAAGAADWPAISATWRTNVAGWNAAP